MGLLGLELVDGMKERMDCGWTMVIQLYLKGDIDLDEGGEKEASSGEVRRFLLISKNPR